MAKAKPNVYLHPDADRALEKLQQELPKEGLPRRTRRQDIVSAMLLYTSREQAAGMLAAFLRAADPEDEG
jgi:hypothetical protein